MNAAQLLHAACELVARPDDDTAGLWPRAAALLARQALEDAIWHQLLRLAPRAEDPNFTVRLLTLRQLHPDPDLIGRVAYTWAALSSATHHQGYELGPTAGELAGWFEVVGEFVADADGEVIT